MNQSTIQSAIDSEVLETAIALRPQTSLFGTVEPIQIIVKAAEVATSLKSVVKTQGLISNIQGKEYPRCEAWTLLGAMLGVFPVCVWTKQVEGGWEARVEARTRDGSILGAAEAQCLRGERNWSNRDDFALRSMAQTRATAKALRMPLGFVMTLAGFEATPSEEMEAIATPTKPVAPKFKAPTPIQPVKVPEKPVSARNQATPEQKAKMIAEIEAQGPEYVQKALAYFIDVGCLLPNERLTDIPLHWVPVMAKEWRDLGVLIAKGSGKPEWVTTSAASAAPPAPNPASAFNPEETEESPFNNPVAPQTPTRPAQQDLSTESKPKDDEWWRDAIVPIPHKGQKRAEYLKEPDTIGSLFDARHDDEDARRRLFGFVSHFEPKPWTGNDGKSRPPSKSDIDFRRALDAFAIWYDKHCKDEEFE